MQTHFTAEQLAMPGMLQVDDALTRCLQCGYCLTSCPTYNLLGNEYDSARGRIYLIKDMLEQDGMPDTNTVEHIDRCMSCLACMSSCPSFVNYMHLVDHARSHIEQNYHRPAADRITRWALAKVLPYPKRLRVATSAARLVRPLAAVMPGNLGRMLGLVPQQKPQQNLKSGVYPAIGERRQRVALLAGCVQQVFNTNINDATIRILQRHGCEVVVVEGSGCCGALPHHMGRSNDSHEAAANNIRVWTREIEAEGLDAIVINTSGCGTVVKDYGHMFEHDQSLKEDAARIADMAVDISELLSGLELAYQDRPPLRVVYHATCSLQFGQRIRYAPKKLLKAAGFTVLEPRDSHQCCGSAATYQILQPGLSQQLRKQKIEALEQESPEVIVAGNIGCMMHLAAATQLPVVHTVELLDWATGGPEPQTLAV